MTLVLGHADVARALPMDECIEAMASMLAAHGRGELFQPLRSVRCGLTKLSLLSQASTRPLRVKNSGILSVPSLSIITKVSLP